jgi:hypothetical protein
MRSRGHSTLVLSIDIAVGDPMALTQRLASSGPPPECDFGKVVAAHLAESAAPLRRQGI